MRRLGLDSNVLAYLAALDHHPSDATKIVCIQTLVEQLEDKASLVVPSQALGELFTVMVRHGTTRENARHWAKRFHQSFEIIDCGMTTMISAVDLAVAHKLQIWDALIVSASVDAGCTLLLSEDMQDGFSWRGLTIVNPFAEPLNGKLLEILAG